MWKLKPTKSKKIPSTTSVLRKSVKIFREQSGFDNEGFASIKTERKHLNGMQLDEIDKKLRSTLHLALGNDDN